MKFLLYATLFGLALATDYQDCGSEGTNIVFTVEGCDIPPCIVERGNDYPATIEFIPEHNVEALLGNITANIGGAEVPWPGFDHDACLQLEDGYSCPLEAGKPAVWSYLVQVLPEYPPITTIATFKLYDVDLDGSEHIEVCIQAPVTIV